MSPDELHVSPMNSMPPMELRAANAAARGKRRESENRGTDGARDRSREMLARASKVSDVDG